MEWTTVTVIIALLGLIVTVTTPLIRLNGNITRLNVILDNIKSELEEQKKALSAQKADSRESHRRLWAHNDEQDETLNDHETRIRVLEEKHIEKMN